MDDNTWKMIAKTRCKGPNQKLYAYDTSYIVPFGVNLSLETKEFISINSSKELTDEEVIERVTDYIYDRYENDDQYDHIPEISLASIEIIKRRVYPDEI